MKSAIKECLREDGPMNMTPMERKGWWLQTDCHMEFEPADPEAFGWVERRMKGWVSRQHGRWVAYKVHGDEFDVLGRFGDRDRAMERVEREYAQQDLALSTANSNLRRGEAVASKGSLADELEGPK